MVSGILDTDPVSGTGQAFRRYAVILVNDLVPQSVKELYVYNAEKARQLLKEAGYPNGFKTLVTITASDADYFAIWKDMWAKVGIELTIDVKESGIVNATKQSRTYAGFILGGGADAAVYLSSPQLQGVSETNISKLDDPIINKALDEVRVAAITDEKKAMQLYREMTKYILDQAYTIPRHKIPLSHLWWPWVKNYSGETHVGYADAAWQQWVWIDQALKKSMGY